VAPAAKAETVVYRLLPVMLLNKIQKQSGQLARKEPQIAGLERQPWQNDAQIAALYEQFRQRDSQMVAMHLQRDASKQDVDAVKEEVAQIGGCRKLRPVDIDDVARPNREHHDVGDRL
jgi:SOS response regulatory protein OraA/RecX